MRFEALDITGAVLVRLERQLDIRGFFARAVCVTEFAQHGLASEFVQSSLSYNRRRGTVRGLHFQWAPASEGKLVRCLRGAIHDVLLDLRPDQPTYLKHRAVLLDQDNRDAVFIPPGIAHGFQTLVDDSEILYQMTDFYRPELAAGVRWNDAAFGIEWPSGRDVVISDRDASYPDFVRRRFEAELRRRTAPLETGS